METLPETVLPSIFLCPIPALRGRNSGPRASFFECDVGDLKPCREVHHRFRPDQIIKSFASESFSHDVSQVSLFPIGNS